MQTFLNANKVFLLGLLGAIGTVLQQYIGEPSVNYKVVLFAIVIAGLSYAANNLRGQYISILGVLGTSLATVATGLSNGNTVQWPQLILSTLVAIIAVVAPAGKPLSYESNPSIVAAKAPPVAKIIALVLVGFLSLQQNAFSQVSSSFFGHLHYKGPAKNAYANAIELAPDSTYTGLRPTATVAVGYSASGGTTVLAFAGIGYFHVTHQSATDTYYTDWGVSGQIGTGSSNGGVTLTNATTVGLFGQFFNNLLTVGIGYNFFNKVALPLVGPGVAFH